MAADVLAFEGGVDVDPDARWATPGGDGDLGDPWPSWCPSPEGGGREVAEDRVVAAGQDRGCGAGDRLGAGVADRVDASEDGDQAALDEAFVDLRVA